MQVISPEISELKSSTVTEVPAGSKTVLNCNSNDYDHNFMFWLINDNQVIGPGNTYDERKYKYEVLSGKLHIDSVSPSESGLYKCVSKKIDGPALTIGQVEMIVSGSSSTFSAIDAVKLIAIVVSIIVIISCAVIYYRLRKQWGRYDGRAVVPVDEEDEEEGAEEIYNRTTTAITHPMPGPSRNQSSDHLIYGIDNQGLDTDFNSVFENIQIKTPLQSLI